MPWDITGMQSNDHFTLLDISPRTCFEIKQTNLSSPPSPHPPALDHEFFKKSMNTGQVDRQRANAVFNMGIVGTSGIYQIHTHILGLISESHV